MNLEKPLVETVAILFNHQPFKTQTKQINMKTKALILIAFAAIITLSFSFVSTSASNKVTVKQTVATQRVNEPIGGFIAEDKF
jgi:hypothetical protein